MNGKRIFALVKVQLKALIREPAYLFLMILFPIMLTLIFGVSFGSMDSEIEGVSLFDTMAPGLLAYACIFMIMTVAQAFSDMREKGLLKRMNTTPLTSGEFIGSHILSNTLISVLVFPDSEHLSPTRRADSLSRWLAILHSYTSGILHLSFGSTFHTICLH